MIYSFSRDTIEGGIDLIEPYALISISSPLLYGVNVNPAGYLEAQAIPAHLPIDENRIAVLRMQFHDIEPRDVQTSDKRIAAQMVLFSAEDARRVAAFVDAWKVNIVIHCDGGISRSTGMANAIADHLDVQVTHENGRAINPNRHVYQLTWWALRPSKTDVKQVEAVRDPNRPEWSVFKPGDRPWYQEGLPGPRIGEPAVRAGSRTRPPDRYRIRFQD